MVKLNFILWLSLVLISILNFDIKIISSLTYVLLLISIFSTLIRPKNHLIVLPFFAFLSPIAGYQILNLLFIDLYFIFLLIHIILLSITKKINIYKTREFYILFTISSLYFISVLLANLLGNLISLKPLIHLLQFVLIYIITTSFAKSKKWQNIVLKVWVLTVFLSSILVINSYFNGVQLIEFGGDINKQINVNNINYFFRASFYYGGYLFSLGIVLLCLFIRQIYSTKLSEKIIELLIIIVCLSALLLIFNKTVIISILLTFGIFILTYYKFLSKKIKRKFFIFLILFFIALTTFIITITDKIDNNQISFLLLTVENLSSLQSRFYIYKVAFMNFSDYPLAWIFGMGPDFLESVTSLDFRLGRKGYYEGTIDSGFISYLIELGIINFCLLIYLLFISIKNSYKTFTRAFINNDSENNISMYIYISLIFLFISLTTQMLGYTKTAWFPFQIILIGYLYKFNNKKYE